MRMTPAAALREPATAPGVDGVTMHDAGAEFWYCHLHDLPLAPALVGRDRETMRLYLADFYDRGVGRKASVRPEEFEAIVEVQSRPGVFESAEIAAPASVFWGALDPVIKATWADRLGECFPAMAPLEILAGVGHSAPFEAPEIALAAILEELGRP